jgi:hypothetical protein
MPGVLIFELDGVAVSKGGDSAKHPTQARGSAPETASAGIANFR